ncbi:MAG: toll/interleukin-1 receptor domain-containing protein, partial [bacterium]|nr:toll/interleukin-1 receptor domain-containing protein [Candidatus Colousia faecequi]
MKKEYDIFISYRREGGKEYARNLTSELVSRGFHPFLDFDELVDGKFDKRITDAIESAPVFMFILSPGSLDRCVNEEDWVRKEILHA